MNRDLSHLIIVVSFFLLSIGGCSRLGSSTSMPPATQEGQQPPPPQKSDEQPSDEQPATDQTTSQKQTGTNDNEDSSAQANALTPQTSSSQDQQTLLTSLESGHLTPFFVLTYSEPGNSDAAVIREKIRQADATSAVDRDLEREREFTDFPFTVDTYLISLNSKEAYQQLLDCAYRYPKVKIIVVPLGLMKLRSYMKVTYSKPLFRDVPTKTFWIGDSPALDVRGNFTSLNLEDPRTYLNYMANCRGVSALCLQTLLGQNYFKQDAVIDGNHTRPVEFLSHELGETAYLRSQGLNGRTTITGKGLLNSNRDRGVIQNISLHHEIWITGVSLTGPPPLALLKMVGSDSRPVVRIDNDRTYSYMLPVLVADAEIPESIRKNVPKMGTLISQLQDVMTGGLAAANNSSTTMEKTK